MIRLIAALLLASMAQAGEIEDTAQRILSLAEKEPLIARADTLHRAAAMLQARNPELASNFLDLANCIGTAGPAPGFKLPKLTADRDQIERLVEEVERHGDDPTAYGALASVIRKNQLSAGLDNPSIRARIALADLDELLDPILIALDGSEVRLSKYRSKKVLLAFWATWCVPCRKELTDLEKLAATSPDTTILALSWEPRDVVVKFLGEHPYNLPVYIDSGHKLADRFHVDRVPASVFLTAIAEGPMLR